MIEAKTYSSVPTANSPWDIMEDVTEEKHSAVEHPNHYCQGGIECIKAIEASMPPD